MALLATVGVGAASASTAGNNTFSIPGTETQKAFDLLDERFPTLHADGAQADVVFQAPAERRSPPSATRRPSKRL